MPERRRRRRGARRRRRLLISGAAAGFLVLLAAGWFSWSAQHVYDDLRTAETEGRTLRDALAEGDVERAEKALDRFQQASDSAADGTGALPWRLVRWVPFVGDDAAALATVSEVLSDLGRAGISAAPRLSTRPTSSPRAPSRPPAASSRSTGSPRSRSPRSAATPPSRPAPSGWPSTTPATSSGPSRRRTSS